MGDNEEENKRITQILESISDAFFALDDDLVVTYFNRAAEQLLVRKSAEVVGRQLFEAFPEAKGSIFEEMYARAVREKVPLTFETYFAENPYENWYDVRVYPQDNGISVYFQVTTERKRAEEQTRITLESIGDGFFAVDGDWRFVYVNAMAERLLGIDRNEVLGESHWEVFPLTLGTRLESEYRKAAAGEVRDFENYYEPWDRWFHNRCFPREGGGMSVYFQDITERKGAEQERERLLAGVQQEKDRLTALINSIADEVWFVDAQGHIVLINAAAARGLGLERVEDFYGAMTEIIPAFEVYDANGRPRALEDNPMNSLLRGETITNGQETVRHLRTGELRYREFTGAPLHDKSGQIIGAVTVVRDVTERKRTEELKEASYSLDQIIHSALDADAIMWTVVSEAAKYLDCDTAAISLREGERWVVRHVHGFPKEVVGSVMNDEEEPHAVVAIKTKAPVAIDDAYNDERVNREHMRKWGVRSVLVVPLVAGNEAIGVIFFNYTRSPFRFADYHLDFALRLAASLSLALENARLFTDLERELAERKRAEADLERLYAAEKQARAEAQSAVQDRDEFLSVAAHELKTPITSLRGYAQTLLRQLTRGETVDPARLKIALGQIDRQSHHLANLVNQLLDLSRLDAGRLILDRRTVDLVELVEEPVGTFRMVHPQRAFVLHAPGSLTARVDPLRLQQVIVNLLDNAVKFSPADSPVEIEFARRSDGAVEVSVRDRGPGIPEGAHERIFERFHQAHEDWHGGLGLGLFISRQVVELHGGSVRVEDPPGGGSRFVITLPVADRAPETDEAEDGR